MNKNRYRVIFSKSKNMFIAVAENIKSQTKAAGQSTNSNQINASSEVCDSKSFHQLWQVKSIAASISLFMAFSPVYAQIQADPAAAAHQKASIGVGQNQQGQNVPVINIQTPKNGVSHNVYNQFDVLQPGVVLNNSRGGASSVIVGQVGANPYLQTGEARVILNEVNSAAASRFEGNLEVAGQRADVIIANPSGINIQGGGFINANKAIFTTGKAQLNEDGSIKQFVVDQGKINVNSTENSLGLGGNSNNADYVDIYAKAVELNAQVHANQNLQVITGSNNISDDLSEIKSNNPESTSPTFALDVKALGGMYANNIFIVGTDKGLGVSNAGTIQSPQSLVITSSGKIENIGTIANTNPQDSLLSINTLEASDIVNNGSIITNGNLFINSDQNLIVDQGKIEKHGADNQNIISISAKGDINLNNSANVQNFGEGGDLYINANNITLGNDVNIGGNGSVVLDAELNLSADAIRNISSVNDISLSAGSLLSLNNTPIYSQSGNLNLATKNENASLVIDSTGLNAEKDVNIYGAGAVSINNLILDKVGETTKTKNFNVNAQGDLTWANTAMLPAFSGQLNLLSNGLLDLKDTHLTANEGINLQAKNINIDTGLTSEKDVNLTALEGDIKSKNLNINSKAGKVSVLAQGHVDLQDPNFSNPHIKPIQINAQKDIIIGSTSSAVDLRSAELSSNEGGIKVQSNDVANLSETSLKAKGNIELFSQGNLGLQATIADSQQHIAINSKNNITFNSPPVFDDPADQGSSLNTQLTAPGIISIISGKTVNVLDLTATGGAVLVEAGESFNVPYKAMLNATGSNLLKNDAKLSTTDGDLTIQTNHALTLDPKIHQLNATGDIELVSKNGALTLLGYGGNNGNGSEQVLRLNTTNGGINLEGTQVELQGAQLEAQKDIKIISSNNDVIIDGMKNKIDQRIVDVALSKQEELVLVNNNLNTLKASDIYLEYIKDMEEYNYHMGVAHSLGGFTPQNPAFQRAMAIQKKINQKFHFLRNEIITLEAKIQDIQSDINYYATKVNGYEHSGAKLESNTENINILSARGISISGSDITAKAGIVDIEAQGVLEQLYTATTLTNGQAKTLNTSIIMDGTQDFYDKGGETDENYSMRTLVNPTILNGYNGVNVRTIGTTKNDNLVLQATGIVAQNGDAKIESFKNILFDSAVEQSYDRSINTEKKKSWGGLKKKYITTRLENESIDAASVEIQAKNISIESKEPSDPNNSIDIYSGKLDAEGNISIRSGGNINFYTANKSSNSSEDVTKKSSFAGIKYNNSKTNSTRSQVAQIPATLKADYIGVKSDFDTRLVGTEFEYLKGATIESGGTTFIQPAITNITDIIKKESNSVVWQSMQDKGSITETAKLPSFNGPTPAVFKAEGGIEVQIPIGEQDQYKVQIKDEIIKLANQPGNEYLNELVKRDDVNWNKVILTQQEWDYKSQGLTGPGAALIVIIVTVLTAGSGAPAAAAAAVNGGALGAGAQAAVLTLASQASVSIINNGGNIGKTLKDLGSKESVKGLVTSVVTAGLLSEVGTILKLQPDSAIFSDRLINNFTNSVGSTLVQTAINGGNLKDNLEAALLSGFAGALQGELAQNIKALEDVNYIVHKIAHAAAGCIAGAIQKSCEAGAIGAAVGEMAADLVPRNENMTAQEIDIYNQKVINTSKLIAGTVSAYAGYDVNIAANSAETAVKNNFLYPKEKVRYELEYAGCSLKSDSESCRDNLVQEYMTLSKQNDQTLINTCNNKALSSACSSMIRVALDYSGSDFWHSYAPTTSNALNELKIDQTRTRDLMLSKIFENPDAFYKAINNIDTRADFFSAMYQKTGAVWFKLADDTSRGDLQGIIFGSGNLFHNIITTTVENVSSFDNKSQYNLENWRSEAGKVIMSTGYESFKNVFQNYQNVNITQWSIDHLVSEQVALQSVHEKYIPNFVAPIRIMMESIGNVSDILNIQSRINTGCIRMGLKELCGVAK